MAVRGRGGRLSVGRGEEVANTDRGSPACVDRLNTVCRIASKWLGDILFECVMCGGRVMQAAGAGGQEGGLWRRLVDEC